MDHFFFFKLMWGLWVIFFFFETSFGKNDLVLFFLDRLITGT